MSALPTIGLWLLDSLWRALALLGIVLVLYGAYGLLAYWWHDIFLEWFYTTPPGQRFWAWRFDRTARHAEYIDETYAHAQRLVNVISKNRNKPLTYLKRWARERTSTHQPRS